MYFDKLHVPLITILATFQAVGFLQAEKSPARPNVLFIAIDDMNDWTGFLGGHPEARTPHTVVAAMAFLEQLARQNCSIASLCHCLPF